MNSPPSSIPVYAPVKICSAVCQREFKQGNKGHPHRSHPLSTYLLSLFSPHNPFLNVWAGTAAAVYDSQNGGALKHTLFGHDLLNNNKKVNYKPPWAYSRSKIPASCLSSRCPTLTPCVQCLNYTLVAMAAITEDTLGGKKASFVFFYYIKIQKFERKFSYGTKRWKWYGDMNMTLLSYSHRSHSGSQTRALFLFSVFFS